MGLFLAVNVEMRPDMVKTMKHFRRAPDRFQGGDLTIGCNRFRGHGSPPSTGVQHPLDELEVEPSGLAAPLNPNGVG